MSSGPYHRAQARTLFLRVPRCDWARVVRGEKTEFRSKITNMSRATNYFTPAPIVAWSQVPSRPGDPDTQLMVLERAWIEPIGAITDDGLAREGFKTRAEFRTYWRRERAGSWLPLVEINVWRVRPARDHGELGAMLLERLYGEHL